jgi:CheY-like chemotaxis protein
VRLIVVLVSKNRKWIEQIRRRLLFFYSKTIPYGFFHFTKKGKFQWRDDRPQAAGCAYGTHEKTSEPTNNPSLLRRILVVDDDRLTRDVISELLKLFGCKSFIFGDPGEALSFFMKDPIEVVLTDLEMPGLNGWEVARDIKQHRSFTPIILMTGAVNADIEVGMKKGHVDFILKKPFKIKELNEVIDEAFEVRYRTMNQ